VGMYSPAWYPPTEGTVMPAVWLNRRRSVTFSVFVNSLSGTFHETNFRFTSSSSLNLSLLYEAQGCKRCYRFADGSGLKQSVGSDWFVYRFVCKTVATRPSDPSVFIKRDADFGKCCNTSFVPRASFVELAAPLPRLQGGDHSLYFRPRHWRRFHSSILLTPVGS
jgi:hypothetical protein